MRIKCPEIFWHGNCGRITITSNLQNNNNNLNSDENDQNNNNNNSNNNNPNSNYLNLIATIINIENNSYFKINPIFISDLNGEHNSTVNICHFSPSGKYLATGNDDNSVII